jgi:hypothetical protein
MKEIPTLEVTDVWSKEKTAPIRTPSDLVELPLSKESKSLPESVVPLKTLLRIGG